MTNVTKGKVPAPATGGEKRKRGDEHEEQQASAENEAASALVNARAKSPVRDPKIAKVSKVTIPAGSTDRDPESTIKFLTSNAKGLPMEIAQKLAETLTAHEIDVLALQGAASIEDKHQIKREMYELFSLGYQMHLKRALDGYHHAHGALNSPKKRKEKPDPNDVTKHKPGVKYIEPILERYQQIKSLLDQPTFPTNIGRACRQIDLSYKTFESTRQIAEATIIDKDFVDRERAALQQKGPLIILHKRCKAFVQDCKEREDPKYVAVKDQLIPARYQRRVR